MLVVAVLGLAFIGLGIFAIVCVYDKGKRIDGIKWAKTKAVIGNKNHYKMRSGRFLIESEHCEQQITYWVNGEEYNKYISSIYEGKKKIVIIYKVKNPHVFMTFDDYITEKQSKRYKTKNKAILLWLMGAIAIIIGILFIVASFSITENHNIVKFVGLQ